MDIWIFGYLGIWVFGYLGIWVFGYLGITIGRLEENSGLGRQALPMKRNQKQIKLWKTFATVVITVGVLVAALTLVLAVMSYLQAAGSPITHGSADEKRGFAQSVSCGVRCLANTPRQQISIWPVLGCCA